MDSLTIIYEKLKVGIGSKKDRYFIPEVWNTWGYEKYTRDTCREGEIIVDPFEFFSDCIRNQIQAPAVITPDNDGTGASSTALAGSEHTSPVPTRMTMYSMFIRAATAWDHYQKECICPGTFLKALCLLPYLRSLGTGIIYLLPVFCCSDRYKKGETGSPYSIKNIYKLDRNLHDPLLGEYSEELLDTEFRAFVEACHLFGMKVMVDYVFRTVSRDSDLIVEHPDWFYWIKLEYAGTIVPPRIGRTKKIIPLDDRALELLYTTDGSKEYLKKFVFSPDRIDAGKWERLKNMYLDTGANILDLIEAEYGITTLPGFSDVINDSQPSWTDATYLRYYFDINEKAEKYITPDQPPSIMQDGVCLRLYPGRTANTELMEYIAGVIPYYQDKFSIDGVRLDMGHALTLELNREIIARAVEKNRDFLLWSEEFDPLKSGAAKDIGFHFINGTITSVYRGLEKPGFNKKLLENQLMRSQLPMIAAVETPDTPRAAWVHRDRKRLEQLIFLNSFLPNTVQFINNGFELMEIQPMNLGIDNTEEGRFVLDSTDPMYGRLAFFDYYRLHWLNEGREWVYKLLVKAGELRRKYIDIISVRENFIENKYTNKNNKLTLLLYLDRIAGKGVFLLANRDFSRRARLDLSRFLHESDGNIETVFSTAGNLRAGHSDRKTICLSPGEVVIAEFRI